MPKELLLYNSDNYPYPACVGVETVVKFPDNTCKTHAVSLFYPKQVIVLDHDAFLECVIVFPMDDEEKIKYYGDFERKVFELSNIVSQYPENTVIWNAIRVIPNHEHTTDVYLFLNNVRNGCVTTRADEKIRVLSFCTMTPNCFVTLDGDKFSRRTYSDITKVIDYNNLSLEEIRTLREKLTIHNSLDFHAVKESKFRNVLGSVFGRSAKKEEQQHKNLIESLHMTEQEKQIFDPQMLSISEGAVNAGEELNALIGLKDVRMEIEKLKAKLLYRKMQKGRRIFVENVSSMHMCFTGAPGTGKTTVARILTGILYDMGYIKDNHCIEINGQNLKGGYTGQTAIITKLVMKSAKNRVLFIDEAYAIFDNYENGYGKEAIAVILKEMEDERDNTIVIFAGYKDEMEEFLTMNDGLKSRINRYIDFKNYEPTELMEILLSILKKKKLYITEDALTKCMLIFKKAALSERFSNGRFVRNLVEKMEYKHASNTFDTKDQRRQDTITEDDITDKMVEELLTHSM